MPARRYETRDVILRMHLVASDSLLLLVDIGLAGAALALGLWLRPWRTLGTGGPPWPWLVAWAVTPLLWSMDGHDAMPLAQPMSVAPLLVLLAGWPLAVVALVAAAAITLLMGQGHWTDGLDRLVWLGVVPATLALGIGAAVRRFFPAHLFVYIFGRGFFGTLAALTIAGVVALVVHPLPAGTALGDLVVAKVLFAFGESFLTGMVIAIFVACRPGWLATYSDRLYLPP